MADTLAAMTRRSGAVVLALLLLGAACGESTTRVDVTPDELTTTTPGPMARVEAAALAMASVDAWTHEVSVELEGVGQINGTTHRQGNLTRMSLILAGSQIDTWGDGSETLLSLGGSSTYVVYPQPSERLIHDNLDPGALLASIMTMESIEASESETETSVTVACRDRAALPPGFLLAQGCGPGADTEITATISKASGLMTGWSIDGSFEIWPGNWVAATGSGIYGPLVEGVDFDRPTTVGRSGAICIAEALGESPDDIAGATVALNELTTVENQELFTECGFGFWPSGIDLNS